MTKEERAEVLPREARDLGVGTAGGRRLAGRLQKRRLAHARVRAFKVSELSKHTKQAKKLFTTGVSPAAIWGAEAHGLTAAQISQMERTAANCTGLAAGRCRDTAVGLNFEPHMHPQVRYLWSVLWEWSYLWYTELDDNWEQQ